jgi:biotin carboxyl carrier protein
MATLRLAIQEHEHEISIARQGDALHVSWDGRTVECYLRQHDGAQFVLEVVAADGKRHTIRAAGAAQGDERQLWVNGQMATYHRKRQRRSEAGHQGSLAATIPAVVTEILVAPGDRVVAGEKLILLESMKMIIPIQAPHDGLVTAVHCAVGEPVQAGVQLVELVLEETE